MTAIPDRCPHYRPDPTRPTSARSAVSGVLHRCKNFKTQVVGMTNGCLFCDEFRKQETWSLDLGSVASVSERRS